MIFTSWAIRYKPMEDAENNFLLIFNSLFMLVSVYLIMLFTDFVPEAENRYFFGYAYMIFFALDALLNVLMFIVISVKDVRKALKKYRLKKAVKSSETKEQQQEHQVNPEIKERRNAKQMHRDRLREKMQKEM